jgi:hypothetical protein
VRDWLEQVRINGKPWDKTPPAPRLPQDVVDKTGGQVPRSTAEAHRLIRADGKQLVAPPHGASGLSLQHHCCWSPP